MARRRNIFQIAVAVFCALLQLVDSKLIGDECELENGIQGFCVGIDHCQEAFNLLNADKTLVMCSYENAYPVICCNDTRVEETKGAKSIEYCEKYHKKPKFYGPGVSGGINSQPKEFLHMAALGFDANNKIMWLCGGSLISLKFVLTAAHCLDHLEFGSLKYVRLGDLDLISEEDDAEVQDFLVAKTYKHPQHKKPSKYHDIALIELDRNAEVTDYVQIACLNVVDDPNVSEYSTVGWGVLTFLGNQANVLQKVLLSKVNNSECNNLYEENQRYYNSGIVESTQICAGAPGKDVCKGDSGGPLQTRIDKYEKAYKIHGVISFGKPCGKTKTPGVYSRVSFYIDWIESIVWPTKSQISYN